MAEDNKDMTDEKVDDVGMDFLEISSKLWAVRWRLVKWSVIGAVIGVAIAFCIPREYTSVVELAPETMDQKSVGGLSSLASMAGINLSAGEMGDAVYPQLYPDVVNSVPFMTSLFNVELKLKKGGRAMTLEQFMEEESDVPWWSYVLGVPGKVIGWLRPDDEDEDEDGEHKLNPFRLNKKENDLVEALRQCIITNVDLKTSVVSISVKMQDPLVAAMLADTVVSRLQEFITDYRTSKARQDLEYIMKLNEEARQNYYDAQQRYADYLDRHQGMILHSAQTTRERLQNEAQLAYNLYNQTAQKVQIAQAKVQESTPVYAVLSPATVALKPTSPKKILFLVGFGFLGFASCVAWMFFVKPSIENFRRRKEEEKLKSETE